MQKILRIQGPFNLERGGVLPFVDISYFMSEPENTEKPFVWVCHALTGNADVFNWWSDFFNPNSPFSTQKFNIICANILGSCYGTTGPLSLDAEGKKWYSRFPEFTIRDIVFFHELLRKELLINRINWLIGPSLGGQQALEWSYLLGDKLDNLLLIATNAFHSAWGIAWNESQRWAIEADPTWLEDHDQAGLEGMKIARSMALLSYRSVFAYNKNLNTYSTNSKSYQRYQGEKLALRFNAFSYYRLTQAMDSHHFLENKSHGFLGIKAKTYIIGISTDLLFPLRDAEFLHENIPSSIFLKIESEFGHDAFLIDAKKIIEVMKPYLLTN